MKKNRHIIRISAIKISLLVLFGFYYSAISFFPHQHLVGGSFIVHSHPYKKDCQGNPSHSHSKQEIQFIQALSVLLVTTSILPFITGSFIRVVCSILKALGRKVTIFIAKAKNCYKLRPPPGFRPILQFGL